MTIVPTDGSEAEAEQNCSQPAHGTSDDLAKSIELRLVVSSALDTACIAVSIMSTASPIGSSVARRKSGYLCQRSETSNSRWPEFLRSQQSFRGRGSGRTRVFFSQYLLPKEHLAGLEFRFKVDL